MNQPTPTSPIDLEDLRRRDTPPARPDGEIATAELRDELQRLRRVRDGEARRLEARIAELERLLPELWERGRRIDELTTALESEQRARRDAEETAAIFREEVELLRQSIDAERERTARFSGTGDPAAPADPYRVWEQRFRDRAHERDSDEVRRLRERIDQQLVALEEKETRIVSLVGLLEELDPEPADGPDDLTRISGIGPAIAAILHDRGVSGFDDLAALSSEELEALGGVIPVYPRRIFDDRWVDQARDLAEERDAKRQRREVRR